MSKSTKVRILFVCLGNICRSPAAHGVFEHMLRQRGLTQQFTVDSAGLLDYHEGELPDPRMRAAAEKRGYRLHHRARPVVAEDFEAFDRIIAMDREVLSSLHRLARKWANNGHDHAKISLFLDAVEGDLQGADVPDPYWSDAQGFEKVLDLIELGCRSLLEELVEKRS